MNNAVIEGKGTVVPYTEANEIVGVGIKTLSHPRIIWLLESSMEKQVYKHIGKTISYRGLLKQDSETSYMEIYEFKPA